MNDTPSYTVTLSNSTSQYPNSSTEYDDTDAQQWFYEYNELGSYVRIIIPIVFGFVTVVGFVGNILVIRVIAADKSMRSTTNIFILSLAIADLAFNTFCVPFTAVTYSRSTWPFGDGWCRIVQYLTYVSTYASVYTLVAMSVDRFLAVVFPTASLTIRSTSNANRTVVTLWFIILLVNTPLLTHSGIIRLLYLNEKCVYCMPINDHKDVAAKKALYVTFFVFGYAFPLVLMCILYSLIIKRLMCGTIPTESKCTNVIRTRKRVTRMVVVVVAVFAFCWLPIQVVFMWQTFGYYSITFIGMIIQMAANVLAYMNSCLNPILYAFLSESFRTRFKKLLFRSYKCRHS